MTGAREDSLRLPRIKLILAEFSTSKEAYIYLRASDFTVSSL